MHLVNCFSYTRVGAINMSTIRMQACKLATPYDFPRQRRRIYSWTDDYFLTTAKIILLLIFLHTINLKITTLVTIN